MWGGGVKEDWGFLWAVKMAPTIWSHAIWPLINLFLTGNGGRQREQEKIRLANVWETRAMADARPHFFQLNLNFSFRYNFVCLLQFYDQRPRLSQVSVWWKCGWVGKRDRWLARRRHPGGAPQIKSTCLCCDASLKLSRRCPLWFFAQISVPTEHLHCVQGLPVEILTPGGNANGM